MKLKNEILWKQTVVNNQDPYGKATYEFANRWASMMEQRIEEGKAIPDIAATCSNEADTDGITGFMYGCAVEILSEAWIHGDSLREWHNRKYLSPEKSNAVSQSRQVVNPAIITFGTQ